MAKSRVAHAGGRVGKFLWLFLRASFAMAWGLASFAARLSRVPRICIRPVAGKPSTVHPRRLLAGDRGFRARGLARRHQGASRVPLTIAEVGVRRRAGMPCCSRGCLRFSFLGAAISGRTASEALEQLSPASLLAGAAFMLFLGPIEEFGWRGYATPLLQRRMAPVFAGLLIGLIWAIWHLPAFFLSGLPQDGWDVMPFHARHNRRQRDPHARFSMPRAASILIAILFHWQI